MSEPMTSPGDKQPPKELDRLSRSLRDVLTVMKRLSEANAGFLSFTEPSTPPHPQTG